jgi:hypothetical protein
MVDPVSSGIQGEWRRVYNTSVDFAIESKEDTEVACVRIVLYVRGREEFASNERHSFAVAK